MLLLAILFLVLTVFGALVGLGDVGHPIRDQSSAATARRYASMLG